jgi:phosphonopyruvate decarboxylase
MSELTLSEPTSSELTLSAVALRVLELHPDACIVSTCGYTSRELFNAADRPGNFYLVGSMGMAAPIALGIALARPDRKVIAIDGDGSLLMNLGVLPMAAAAGADLLHVVVDNGMHESTGGQATARRSDFVALALAAGYRGAERVETAAQLRAARLVADRGPTGPTGPTLLHAITGPRTEGIGKRVEHTPQQLVERVRESLGPRVAVPA